MAHEVENMFSVKKTPWHGLGIILQDNPSIDNAIIAAGLNWDVGLKPLVTKDTLQDVPAFATFRSTDNSILGVVGERYTPLQNKDAFAFFQTYLDLGLATLETAGSLREGKRVFVLAKIKSDPLIISQGDEIEKYILLSNSHDGTLAVRVGFTPVRVVCSNTLAMAHNSDASRLIRVRHSKDVKKNLEEIQKVMDIAHQEFNATAEQFRFLTSREINTNDLKKYVKIVMGTPESDLTTEKNDRIVAEVIPLFEKGIGNDIASVKGTYWTAYNAMNEFLGYHRGKSQDIRVDSLWFGQGATLNKRALEVATEMAKAA